MALYNTTWHHIRRSPYQTFAAVLIILQTFFVISIFSLIIFISSKTISYFESVPQVTAFFKNEVKPEDIDSLKKQVENSGKAAKVKFVSKNEALEIYKQQNKDDDPLLLDLVTADILPASLEVSAIKIDDLPEISDMLQQSPDVQKVIFQKDVVETLRSWTDDLRKIGFVLTSVLALDSILIMMIIIGIKVSQKKEEIEVMRLLGATNWYIRWPFMLEGIAYAVTGAVIGWLLSMGTLIYATPFLSYFLKGVPIFPIDPLLMLGLLGFELLLALLLGIIASFLAVLRYLK
jgi:cell division transport system permease protein